MDEEQFERALSELWDATRRLSGRPDLEYTFHLFMFRHLAMLAGAESKVQGFDLLYEPLTSWGELESVLELRDALAENEIPTSFLPHVNLGMHVFDSAYYAASGRIPLPTANDRYRGRHSVVVLGQTPRGDIAFGNSWGNRWGDGGVGYISRAYFEAHVDAVWLTRVNYVGWSPAMDAALSEQSWRSGRPATPLLTDLAATWMTPNRPRGKTIRVEGGDAICRVRATFSSRDDLPALEVVEMRQSETLLGRAHILYPRDSDRAVVEEFFVPPDLRRRGFGSHLHAICRELVSQQTRSIVEMTINEADSAVSSASGSRAFLERLGYEWQSRRGTRPNITAIAISRM